MSGTQVLYKANNTQTDTFASQIDKVRLLMLYILSKDGLFDDDKRKLLWHAKLQKEYWNAIDNLKLLGVQVTRPRQKPGEKSLRKKKDRKRTPREEEAPYELSRYVPTIKRIMKVRTP